MLVGMSVLVEMSVLVGMSVRVTSRQTHINVLSMCTHSDQCTELQLQLAQLVERKSDIERKQQPKAMLPPTRPTQR